MDADHKVSRLNTILEVFRAKINDVVLKKAGILRSYRRKLEEEKIKEIQNKLKEHG